MTKPGALDDFRRIGFSGALEAIRRGVLPASAMLDFAFERQQQAVSLASPLREGLDASKLKLARKQIESAKEGARLRGVPFSAKDHIDVSGFQRSEGNTLTLSSVSRNASVIDSLFGEGAVCAGKGKMAERGRSYHTSSRAFGTVNNPFNNEYSPGGSGGGDAASVQSGMAWFGVAVDSGGSVRVPASFCGLFGLAPTPGMISDAGLTSASLGVKSLFRTLGPIALTLRDLRVLYSVMSAHDSSDPRSAPIAPALKQATSRVGVMPSLRGTPLNQEVAAALSKVSQEIAALSVSVDSCPGTVFEETYEPFILLAGPASLLAEDLLLKEKYGDAAFADESESLTRLRERIAQALPTLEAAHVMMAWSKIGELRYRAAGLFEDYDCILAPVCTTTVPKHQTETYEIEGKQFTAQDVFLNCSATNALGLPALSFPVSLDSNGLPIALQLIGPRHSEPRLIELADRLGYRHSLAV